MNVISSVSASVTARITVVAHVVAAHITLGTGGRRVAGRERGDVPGWVLITLMTAGLVTILWKLAGDQLATMFTEAMSSVTGP